MTRPTFDAQSHYQGTTAPTSITAGQWPHTVAGNVLEVWLYFNTNVSSLTVSFNSVSMTQVATNNSGGRYGYLFILLNPTIGTYDITASWSPGSGLGGVAASYYNCSGYGTGVTAVGTTSPASISLTTTSNDLATSGIGATRNSNTTPPTISVAGGETVRDTAGSGVASAIRVTSSDESTTGTVAMDWTITNFNNYVELGVVLLGSSQQGFFAVF